MTLRLVFTASLLDAKRQRDSVENKPVSLLVVPLGKALSWIPPSWCGRQMHCKKFWVIALPNFGQMYALPKKNGQKPNFFWV